MQNRGANILLLQFSVKNYRSFYEKAVLDMTATNIKEHSNAIIMKNGIGILPIAAIYGANASGKTNFLLALSNMMNLIVYQDNEISKNVKNRTVPFFFNSYSSKEPTEYEIVLNLDDKEYRYGYSIINDVFIEEWLYEKNFLKNTRSKEKKIFKRLGQEFDEDVFMKENDNKIYNYCRSMINEKQLLLPDLAKKEFGIAFKIVHWCTSVLEMGCTAQDFDDCDYFFKNAIGNWLQKYDDLNKNVLDFVKEFDPSIKNIEVVEEKDKDMNIRYKYLTYHIVDGKEEPFIFDIESSGTKKMLTLITIIFLILKSGGVMLYDEIDIKLHPLIMRKLLAMFHDRQLNVGYGQLIFASHNIISLDSSDLRRDEIWFVEKKDQKSELYSLYDFKYNENTVRSDMDFGKNYLAGRFGAIPYNM